MRSLFQFAGFVVFVFVAVGHFLGGWYVGIAPQTPIYVYNKTATTVIEREAKFSDAFPVILRGRLRDGTLTVEGSFERPASFQSPGRPVIPYRTYFSETFNAGQPIYVGETLERGVGIYRVHLKFEDATGSVSVDVPPRNTF